MLTVKRYFVGGDAGDAGPGVSVALLIWLVGVGLQVASEPAVIARRETR